MIAFVVTVPAADVELASDLLWSLGVVAVEERSPSRPDGVVGHDQGAAPTVELWTSLGDDRTVIDRAATLLDPSWHWRTVEVDEAVADTWRRFATPTTVDAGFVVSPAWVSVADAGATVLSIEPGATFGLGDHPTTVLCLRALRRLAGEGVLDGALVLDVGCGSGVLAVAAARLGAARADGIDISPAAPQVTSANAERNGVADRVTASTTPLAEVDGGYDVVMANILAPTLVELAPDLVRVLAVDGVLVVSGVLAGRSDHVVAALAPLRVTRRDESAGWAAITLRR